MHKIGFCSYRKSGNYLLYKIVEKLINKASCFSSFNAENKIWNDKFYNKDLAYPEELCVDEIVFHENKKWQLYKGPLRNDLLDKDIQTLNKHSSLILTHEPPSAIYLNYFFSSFRKWIYIIRDGRAVINSLMHFLVSPVIKKRHPEYKINNVHDIYNKEGYVEKHIDEWAHHITKYKKYSNYYKVIKYEDLIKNKKAIIKELLRHLSVCETINIDEIVEQTSFNNMKNNAKSHVRKGNLNDWKYHFKDHHINYFKKNWNHLLIEMDYEKDNQW